MKAVEQQPVRANSAQLFDTATPRIVSGGQHLALAMALLTQAVSKVPLTDNTLTYRASLSVAALSAAREALADVGTIKGETLKAFSEMLLACDVLDVDARNHVSEALTAVTADAPIETAVAQAALTATIDDIKAFALLGQFHRFDTIGECLAAGALRVLKEEGR